MLNFEDRRKGFYQVARQKRSFGARQSKVPSAKDKGQGLQTRGRAKRSLYHEDDDFNQGHGFGFGYLCGYWEDYCVPARYEERCVQVWVADPVVYETFGGRLGWGRFDRRREYRHF